MLRFLLRAGAKPSHKNRNGKLALKLLLESHVLHHDPTRHESITAGELTHFNVSVATLCSSMQQPHVHAVFSVFCESGFCGVICEPDCSVYTLLLRQCSQPRSLSHMTRLQIWMAMGSRFYDGCDQLPLPTEIQKYVFELTS